MFFLLRMTFWLAILIALIPVNPADLRPDQRPVSTLETVSIARAIFNDAAGFCERNPAACTSGRELVSQFGAKAKAGWTFASGLFGTGSEADAQRQAVRDDLKTGAVKR